ncbi:3'-5' exonuclease, partial [Natrialba taiwanensis]
YLLTRTNRQTAKLAWGLRDAGVPYLDLKPNGSLRRWRDPMPTLLAALRSFDAGEDIPIGVLEIMLRNVTRTPARASSIDAAEDGQLVAAADLSGRGTFDADTYRQWFPNTDGARDLITEFTLEDWQRDLLLGAIESRVESHPDDVRIGTIHASKGLESPCVLLFPPYSQRQLERFQGDYEAEERRLYYVGMTRSSDDVRICHDFYAGKAEFPPLAR